MHTTRRRVPAADNPRLDQDQFDFCWTFGRLDFSVFGVAHNAPPKQMILAGRIRGEISTDNNGEQPKIGNWFAAHKLTIFLSNWLSHWAQQEHQKNTKNNNIKITKI